MRRLGRNRVGVWLGVIAVAFYLWLPGHFAGHVVQTAEDALAALDGGHGVLATHGHAHHPAGHDDHHGGTCPICAAAAASAAPAAAMLPVLAVLPTPQSLADADGIAASPVAFAGVTHSPYAPRGPPPTA
jgi:DUF2946 family protein